MTADEASALPSSAGDQAGAAKRVTHRLLCPDKVRGRFRDKPAVAELILAVRDELVREFGEVDTLKEFARRVKAKHPKGGKPADRLRRTFSDQLTKAPGPSSPMILFVLDDVVAAERRDGVEQRFNALYIEVRGEPLPYAKAPVATQMPRQAEAPVAESLVPGAATTAELRELVTELRKMITARDAQEAALRNELAARTDELARLRRNLGPINLLPTPARWAPAMTPPQRDAPPRQDRRGPRPQPASPPNQPEAAKEDVPILWPPADRYATLAALKFK